MKRKRMYIYIAIAIGVFFLIGLLFNIRPIKEFSVNVIAHMTNIWVFISAAAVGFVFVEKKYYWFIVTGAACLVSVFIQLILVKNGFPVMLVFNRAVAFVGIVFAMNFARLFIANK